MILLAWFIQDALETVARKAPNSNNMQKATRSTKLLLAFGIPAILFTVILAGRIVWEETFLTIQQGPQMIGFSLAHGVGGILFFAPLALSIWQSWRCSSWQGVFGERYRFQIGIGQCSRAQFWLSGSSQYRQRSGNEPLSEALRRARMLLTSWSMRP